MQKFISGKNINFRDIETCDAEFVLMLRTDERKNSFLHQTENNVQKQVDYIDNYKKKENEWYFIIETKNGEQLGTLRIYDVQYDLNRFTWGSWLLKDSVDLTVAIESVIMLYDFAFYTLGFTSSYLEVRKANRKVIQFHKMFNVEQVSENKLNYYYIYTKERYEKVRSKFNIF